MAKAFSICSYPGCLEPVERGKCPEHERRPWANTSPRNKHRPKDWRTRKAFILRRDNYTCYQCGGEAEEVDHVIPVARGGDHEYRNLKAICKRCHKVKTRSEK